MKWYYIVRYVEFRKVGRKEYKRLPHSPDFMSFEDAKRWADRNVKGHYLIYVRQD